MDEEFNFNSFLERMADVLPDLLSPTDLVKYGIYKSNQAAYEARRKGDCPGFLRIARRGIVYPKESVIKFLSEKYVQPLVKMAASHQEEVN